MKNVKRISAAVILLAASVPVYAQWSDTGQLQVNGNMPLITELQIEDLGVTLDLSDAAADVHIATVRERSNSTTGYQITITSANGGELQHSSGQGSLPYTLEYGAGNQIDLTTGGSISNSNVTPAQGLSRDVLVSHGTGDATSGDILPEGSYQDTLTFTISAE
ncbi:hypothetical protein [Spirochaeta africana]|uniref:Secreted protein n=1 Tax=Spirochaeta africana (strain ATCC 700263 / DSM 8902 / Z-7692) TaxID=889378 RepID=H9UFX6_SPIAZ|nr:hypothetical protein [Spirochaeta africana]AFG36419.1 hypothetical protein Spiaf_0311 [Spirochaeta africana DSM 8902]